MSYPQDGRDMDEQPTTAGSVRRARERALAGLPREDFGAGGAPLSGMPVPTQSSPPRPPPPRPSPPRRPMMAESSGLPPTQAPSPPSTSRLPRPQAPAGLQGRGGQIGVAISRPMPVPQWPLAGPPIVTTSPPQVAAALSDSGSQPPQARGPPPQRPPRPSRVPSILDGSRIQDPTPFFQYTDQPTGRESGFSVPQSASSTSRPTTIDSVGSIPDFPLPMTALQPPAAPPPVAGRRSVTLGPPPSARRGASSFYSNASFVSPIPEESPRSRSHTSYASSAAIPGSFGDSSPGLSPGPYYDEGIREESSRESVHEDEREDESQLVRSASVGKRGKALLVTTPAIQRTSEVPEMDDGAAASGNARGPEFRPSPSPLQPPRGPFQSGTGYVDTTSSSSSSLPKATRQAFGPRSAAVPLGAAVTADALLSAYDAASSSDPSSTNRRASISPPSRPYSRLSAIRRPPRLDIDAVRTAESRGSLTSLPDLIRRATRLAASLEKGRRPASRFDDLDYYGGRDGETEVADYEKHQSGLSDMLAAFPPPAQPAPTARRTNNNRQSRGLIQSVRDSVTSWPLPASLVVANNNRPRMPSPLSGDETTSVFDKSSSDANPRRRCCGLPMWGFILLLVVMAVIITAAVVVPIEFFVVRRAGNGGSNSAQPALAQCQAQLSCANGGTNIVSPQGTCSCICTNGFTGATCTIAGSAGCTTTNIVDQSPNIGSNLINNVTLGDALPRLIQGAQANFSIPLSVTQILAKFNAASLSCGAENALVTFNGQATRQGEASAEFVDPSAAGLRSNSAKEVQVINGVAIEIVTVTMNNGVVATRLRRATTAPLPGAAYNANDKRQATAAGGGGGYTSVVSFPTSFPTPLPPTTTTTVTTTISNPTLLPPPSSSSSSLPSPPPPPQATFRVTEEVVDFARVGVLLVLQEQLLRNAEAAQIALQRLFNTAAAGRTSRAAGITVDQARNVSLGNGNSINLVNFQVDVGAGVVGRGVAPRPPRAVKARSAASTAVLLPPSPRKKRPASAFGAGRFAP